jgi:hypothetical protein
MDRYLSSKRKGEGCTESCRERNKEMGTSFSISLIIQLIWVDARDTWKEDTNEDCIEGRE